MATSRMCIACRSIQALDKLWRFSRSTDGFVCWDALQNLEGRGAYVCRNKRCFEQAIQRKAFVRAFKKAILGISMPVDQES